MPLVICTFDGGLTGTLTHLHKYTYVHPDVRMKVNSENQVHAGMVTYLV